MALWRYSHRGRGGAAAALLRDCCAGHRPRAELLRGAMEEQPYRAPFTAASREGREHAERVQALVAAARATAGKAESAA